MNTTDNIILKPCEICGKPTRPWHHKFSQNGKVAKQYKRYLVPGHGHVNLIDHPRNKQNVCIECNSSHQAIGLIIWDEKTFCEEMGREFGIKIEPLSKESQQRRLNDAPF